MSTYKTAGSDASSYAKPEKVEGKGGKYGDHEGGKGGKPSEHEGGKGGHYGGHESGGGNKDEGKGGHYGEHEGGEGGHHGGHGGHHSEHEGGKGGHHGGHGGHHSEHEGGKGGKHGEHEGSKGGHYGGHESGGGKQDEGKGGHHSEHEGGKGGKYGEHEGSKGGHYGGHESGGGKKDEGKGGHYGEHEGGGGKKDEGKGGHYGGNAGDKDKDHHGAGHHTGHIGAGLQIGGGLIGAGLHVGEGIGAGLHVGNLVGAGLHIGGHNVKHHEHSHAASYASSGGHRLTLYTTSPFPEPKQAGQPPAHDTDGVSPVYVGSAVLGNSLIPCKISPHLPSPVSVAYGGKEHGHQGKYDLLPYLPEKMEYVPTSHGAVPPGKQPIEGGYEDNGAKLYHAIGVVNGTRVPGKAGAHLGGCIVGAGGIEHIIKDSYEILCWK